MSTAATRGKSNGTKGKTAERAVARYLRTCGWPQADRAVKTGYRTAERVSADPGDITGCPGLVISIKDCQIERVRQWLIELDAMANPHDQLGGLGLLVVKRRGHADPAEWWAWLLLADLRSLLGGSATVDGAAPVRLTLSDLVGVLRGAGYTREVMSP